MADKCRSCGAEIRWVRTAATGKAMPLDPEPAPDGNVCVDPAGDAVVLSAGQARQARLTGLPLYRSHFASCPDHAKHRKAKG